MRHGLLFLCVLLAGSVMACPRGETGTTTPEGGDTAADAGPVAVEPEPEPEPPSPVKIRVRAIHVAAAASKAPVTVSFSVTEEPTTVADALAFGSTSSYVDAELPPETGNLELALAAEGFTGAAEPAGISDGAAHTAIVYSDAETAETLHVAVFSDAAAGPEAGMRARFFHAVPGWAEVDVCTPGETPRAPGQVLFAAVAYGGIATEGYSEIPAMENPRIQVREANAETPCSGRVLGGVDLRPPEGVDPTGQNLTFIAIGRATGRPAVPRGLLVCTDAPAEAPACFRLAMRAR